MAEMQDPLAEDSSSCESRVLSRIPMEDRERYPGFWKRFWETLKLGICEPLAFFERIPQGESAGAPLKFALLLSVPGYLFLCLYPLMFGFMGLIEHLAGSPQDKEPPFLWMSLGCFGGILLAPLLQIALWLCLGVVQYLFLRLWGVHDAEVPLGQDLRAFTYAQGYVALAFWTPLGPIAGLLVVVVAGLGYARMHKRSPWRGIAATLTPFVLVALALLTAVIVAVVKAPRPARGRSLPDSAPSGQVRVLSPDEQMEYLVDQAAIGMNRYANQGMNPEFAIATFIASPEARSYEDLNPCVKGRPIFRSGEPPRAGEVVLNRSQNYRDNVHRLHPAVEIQGRSWSREFHRTIQF